MKKFVIANWKSNPSNLQTALSLFQTIENGAGELEKGKEAIICPPFVYLEKLNEVKKSNLKLGAQNCFWEDGGPYTGEISPTMLKNLGVQYVIVGHSERRKYFQEDNRIISKKISLLLSLSLSPILCIGESKEEKEKGKRREVLGKELSVIKGREEKIIVAYEPLWAIGSGKPISQEEAKIVFGDIKEMVGESTPLLYGGSVNSKNVSSFSQAGFNGVLVGGASLEGEEFLGIIRNV